MKTYAFIVDLSRDLTDREIDSLFEAFQGDVTSGVTVGQPILLCSIEAPSLDRALFSVLEWVQGTGIDAQRIEIEHDSLSTLLVA
ncbi:MAG TPA: hypothetical protein VFG50_14330 [Rhodothermales bacterium]|nr:hypothetical protein [Rhodothermales bacterium]